MLWNVGKVLWLDSEGSSSIPILDPALLPFSLTVEGMEGTESLIQRISISWPCLWRAWSVSQSCKTCVPCCQEKSSSRTVSHPAVSTAVNFSLPKMEANLCRQTHPWCKYTESKFSVNKSVPSSRKELHGCFYLLLSVSLIEVQKVSKFLMTAAFPIPACCMTFRYWKQMNNWKQSFDHATFRCFWSLPKRPQKTPCTYQKANTSISSDFNHLSFKSK